MNGQGKLSLWSVKGPKRANERILEWFSFECRKTKTKVITLANHIGHRQYIEPIKTRSNYMWLTQSAGKSCERVTIGFGFTSDWMKRWRESFKPIASCRKCKTNYFSTLKWKPLYGKKTFWFCDLFIFERWRIYSSWKGCSVSKLVCDRGTICQ